VGRVEETWVGLRKRGPGFATWAMRKGSTARNPEGLKCQRSIGSDRGLGGFVVGGLRASGNRDCPTARRPPGSRRGAFIASARVEYGFARGGPVPDEPALGNRAQPGWRKRGFPRASRGQDARRERPARWHGLTPSLREVNPTRASGEMARAHPEPRSSASRARASTLSISRGRIGDGPASETVAPRGGTTPRRRRQARSRSTAAAVGAAS